MRTLLFYFGVLTLLLLIVVIVGHVIGKSLITDMQYFFVFSAFIVSALLYDKKNPD